MFSKREFQKTIAGVRRDLVAKEYPKAMCTAQQFVKGTATVNCGGEWVSEKWSAELARKVMKNPRFTAFLAYHRATAILEQVRRADKAWTQVRINFANERERPNV